MGAWQQCTAGALRCWPPTPARTDGVTALGWAVMDLSGPYRKAFSDTVPHAAQIADPFHVIKLANSTIDDVRRRVWWV